MVKSDAAKNAGCDEVLITPEATLFDRCRCFNTAFTGASSMDEGFNCCLPKWKLTVGFTMGLCKQAQSLDESCKQSLGTENIFKVGDGQCDSTGAGYNTRACGYDGGDCCRSTCNAKLLPCGQGAPFDCKDPDHAAPKQEGGTGGTGGAAESLNDVTLDDDEVIVVSALKATLKPGKETDEAEVTALEEALVDVLTSELGVKPGAMTVTAAAADPVDRSITILITATTTAGSDAERIKRAMATIVEDPSGYETKIAEAGGPDVEGLEAGGLEPAIVSKVEDIDKGSNEKATQAAITDEIRAILTRQTQLRASTPLW